MLREFHRVLKQGGRIAGYVIHTPAGLSAEDEQRAADLGPSAVASPAPTEEMVADAGLEIAAQEDVTESFRDTCQAILDVRAQLADKLRAEEGSALYDEEQEKNAAMVIGIDESLLVRSLFLIEKKGNVRRI